MSGDKNNLRQDEGALRILEALSAVDEELLERSGMSVAAEVDQQRKGKVTDMSSFPKQPQKQPTKQPLKQPPRLWRYGRVCAACLAIFVVGVMSWNGLQLTRMIWSAWGGAGAQDSAATAGGRNQTTSAGTTEAA